MPKNKKDNDKWKLSRRDFLKLTGAAGASGGLLEFVATGPNPAIAATVDHTVKTVCPYCSVGCGLEVAVDAGGNVVDIYGDATHVINQGALDPKSQAALELVNSDQRLGTENSVFGESKGPGGTMTAGYGPMKRTGSGSWQAITWDTAFSEIASELKTAKTTYGPKSVAFLGSAQFNNEEAYVLRKLIALFGNNNTEHQARI